jgi:hypothetical protein
VISLPFSVLVTNPVQRISIIREPIGSFETAVALTVQPRVFIISNFSLEGQHVRASADPSCTSGATVLFDTCIVLSDSTCEFHDLAVIGINREVKCSDSYSGLYFWSFLGTVFTASRAGCSESLL